MSSDNEINFDFAYWCK